LQNKHNLKTFRLV